MKQSLLATMLMSSIIAGCSSTDLKESMGLNAPFPELTSQTAQLTPAAMDELASNPLLTERSIYFGFNKYDIKSEYSDMLAAHAEFISKYNVAVAINGNADFRGSHEYNLSLGQKRSVAVGDSLSSLGIGNNNVETVSYGEENANQECTGSACDQDRRADIVYVGE
jgi:peptidoglycan-associated lipoprotein